MEVYAANDYNGPGGKPLLNLTSAFDGRLEKILGDDAYNGVFAEATRQRGLVFEKASRPENAKGFVPIAKRWVVERIISWTNVFRHIVKDHEYSVESSETWLILANMTIMLQRIERRAQ